jgi:hypothetical protein
MKKDRFKIGEKISTVLNWPTLMDGTTPMHVLLEVLEGGTVVEGLFVPNTKAMWIAPIEDQQQIISLLERNGKYVPNRLRLHAYKLHSQIADTFEALNYLQVNTVDVGVEITEESQRIQNLLDQKKALHTTQVWKIQPENKEGTIQ